MSDANLPLITLRRGAWLAELFDPRPDPAVLGARFIHGGWIHRLSEDGRELAGRTGPAWSAYGGHGFPETFESGLGWHLTAIGEEFLRPGAGRLVRQDDHPSEQHANARLSSVLAWEVESGADWATFRTADAIRKLRGVVYGYRLERSVRLVDDGVVSSTAFTIRASGLGMLPVSWFAHSFFRQTRSDGTGFQLPAAARILANPRYGQQPPMHPAAAADAGGLWRLPVENARSAFAGLWGCREPSTVHLAPEAGGGRLTVALDAPLDHIVLWGNHDTASFEPKIARTMLHDERAEWSISYRRPR